MEKLIKDERMILHIPDELWEQLNIKEDYCKNIREIIEEYLEYIVQPNQEVIE